MSLLSRITGQGVEDLQEEVFQESGMTVADGVVKGVKIIGVHSKNGREYSPAARRDAAKLYEGAKVNINHPKGKPGQARDYQDRFGVLRDVREATDGVYGDLHFNPKHPLAEQFAWDAEHAPENVGLSHNARGRQVRKDGRSVVESIQHVVSVDVVADPATNISLFESVGMKTTLRELIEATDYQHTGALLEMLPDSVDPEAAVMPAEVEGAQADPVTAVKSALADEAMKIFMDPAIDAAETGKKVRDLVKAAEDVANKVNPSKPDSGGSDDEGEEDDNPVTEAAIEKAVQKAMGKQLTQLQESVGPLLRETAATRFLAGRKLTPERVGTQRMAELTECEDEAAMAKLAEGWPPYLQGAKAPLAESANASGATRRRPSLLSMRKR